MRVLLKMTLDCSPDVAWAAIRNPQVFATVSSPFTSFSSLEDDGFPPVWTEGRHRVAVSTLGGIEIGEQAIDISFSARRDGTRIMHDFGGGESGALAAVTLWRHSMAIAPLPDGRTLYRDELKFRVGAATLLAWPLYWAFWQWRALRLRQLAPTWG